MQTKWGGWMNRALFLTVLIISFGLFATHSCAGEVDPNSTALPDAAEAQDWDEVARLLESNSPIAASQPDGMTALHWAVFGDRVDVVKLLLLKDSDPNSKTRYGITPLIIACESGSAESIAALLEAGADATYELSGGETPLMIAARTGSAEGIRHLLKHGANPEVAERSGQTALMWAAARGNVQAVDALIEGGADLNRSLKSGFTAMMFAARNGHADVVHRLLAAGVDVNAVMEQTRPGARAPRKGTSALTLAVESGHFELAMMLIEAGADPNDQRSGFAPLHAMSWVRKPARGEGADGDPPPRGSGHLTSLQFVRALVASGADVNLRLKDGKKGRAVLSHEGATPFLLASKNADLDYLKLLVELGADPTIPNVDGCTALMAAAGVGVRAVGEEAGTEPEVIETLKYLIAHGLDVNTVDKNRETAMHGAAYRCFPEVIEFLAAQGADPALWNHKNKSGWTPVLIGEGHRPGSFKPSPETVQALMAAMGEN
ncbi:ankyrin repeat domain-containing protein [Thalassoglobus sp. JC818]|uniref:ankyrin repeat domain-containing protein n=1 Tax=Thalassoglobus sp. JC818 TaxID=3232136 RepID=UPI00345A9CFB